MTISSNSSAKTRPAQSLKAVSISGSDVVLAVPCRSFFVGTAGSVVVIPPNDTTPVTIVSSGSQYHPIEVKTFVASGTTASNIVALY